MKHICFILVFIFCHRYCSISQVSVDFENKDIRSWTQSEDNHWGLESEILIGGKYSLKHLYDNLSSGHDQISIDIGKLDLNLGSAIWRFQVCYGYTPSSSNNWNIFIVSDDNAFEMTPSGLANGYIIGVNFTGSDDCIKLWKKEDKNISQIINTEFNWQDSVKPYTNVGFEIKRSSGGNWEIKIDKDGRFDNLISIGKGFSDEINIVRHFGVLYNYTSSQDRKFWFDDLTINGSFIYDTTPPAIIDYKVITEGILLIEFSESILNKEAFNPFNYQLNHSKYPDSISKVNQYSYNLIFLQGFRDGEMNYLNIKNIKDEFNNSMPDTAIEFTYYIAKPHDIIINEIMADPDPSIDLPNVEYIELFNRSSFDINLTSWFFYVGNKGLIMPDFMIGSQKYLIVCDNKDYGELKNYGQIMGIEGFPALKNETQYLTLEDNNHKIISSVHYTQNWYDSDYKSLGGWSLERIDYDNVCEGSNNWKESVDIKGGTPGEKNSVYKNNPDFIMPGLFFFLFFPSDI